MLAKWLAAALVVLTASAASAAFLVDRMPAFDDRVIFIIEVALALALALLVFAYSLQSDRAVKSNLSEVRSVLRRNEKAEQIRRNEATRTLHSTITAILGNCGMLAEIGGQPGKTPKSGWKQLKDDLGALHRKVKESANGLGRELEHAGYLDDRAHDDIAAAVGLLEETVRANDEERTIDTGQYRNLADALSPVLLRLERRLGLDEDTPLAVPVPAYPADPPDRLKIRLDRTVYYPNSVIRASVAADEPFPSGKVTVAILDENLDELAKKTKKAPKANRRTAGALTMDIRPKGLAVDRRYIARATCGGLVSEAMFAVDQSAPVVQTDKSVYMIDGDMIITVMDPSANTDSAAEEHVGNAEKSRLVIKSPHGTIDGYRLGETGRSTGIFQGIVRCMGVRDDGSVRKTMLDDGVYVDRTQGTGIKDGVIACAPDNLVRIRYTNEFGTSEAFVFVAGFTPAVELDCREYPCTASVGIRAILPDFGPADGGQSVTIGDDRQVCWVAISTSEGSLDGYRLAEEDPGSGIFAGTVSLTGLVGMGSRKSAARGVTHEYTRGAGPHDGMLACKPHDAVRVSVKSAFAREARAEAPVRWHIGDVRMSKAVYLPGEEAAVRVADADMSVSRDRPDEFQVRAWSDSDKEGIPVTVRETSRDSGVFEGRFATGDVPSSPEESILEAADGDTVYAEYVDETLPDPYSNNDSVEITTSALITTKNKIPAALERLVVDKVHIWNSQTGGGALVAGDDAQVLVRVRNPGQEISFTALLQVTDLDGAMAKALYQPMSARAGGYASHTFRWMPAKPGVYGIHLALWKGIDNPKAYSPSVFRPVQVLDPRAAGAGKGGDQGGAEPPAGAHDGGGPEPPAPREGGRNAGGARHGPKRRRHGR